MIWPRAASANRVFLDSSAYFALANSSDIDHPRAIEVATFLGRKRRRLFTTNYIFAETHALLLRRMGRVVAARFIVELDSSGTIVVRVSSRDERRAREIITRHDDKDYSLTDATSFAVMERLRIPQAFTFDHHFAQYGLSVLNQPDRP